jgi:hypothetical protein
MDNICGNHKDKAPSKKKYPAENHTAEQTLRGVGSVIAHDIFSFLLISERHLYSGESFIRLFYILFKEQKARLRNPL